MTLAPSVLARAVLILGLLATVMPTSAQEPDSVLADGFATDAEGLRAYRYVLYSQGKVLLSDLGPSAGSTPEDLAAIDSTVSDIVVSRDVIYHLNGLAENFYTDDNPVRRFGFHIESDRLRILFDQGLPIWVAVCTALLLLMTGGGAVGVTLTRRERSRREREAAARQRALHAREAERSRLAREIHDGPLQDVHALRLLSGGQIPEHLSEEASRIARELRAIAEGLRPPALGRFGLAAALSAHANRVKERHPGVTVGLDLEEDGTGPDALPDVVRSALFRIAQEAITNAIEHGHASRVDVRLALATDERPIELEIRDNGSGLPWDSRQPDFSTLADEGHFGLVGMYERVAAIGGTLTLAQGGIGDAGARVHVSMPDDRRAPLPSRRTLSLRRSHTA
ncbi:sensor histidine kinase [Rubrivirga sp. SAORIC476]|uniref:sensor histidine kinase n=1 Tax=Rubrivirga sp. SAORIC476 TaxID=1961794 RepID=UPI000BA96B13|nr:ATP-binding protein [Rubrivirga sp. SAORIC476]